jgi:hypothetical protein
MVRCTRSCAQPLARIAIVVAITAAAALPAALAGAAARAPGTGKPPAGTGMNTPAAFANPLCRKDAGPYGNLDFVTEGGGPVCVAVWKKGADNGGATYQGVTKDSIDVVVLVPNEQQLAGGRPGQTPVDHATNKTGTVTNAFKDTFAAFEHQAHETYGRTINLEFVTSSGDDEAAQRADAVTVKAKKPFAVIDGTYTSEPVFGTELAAAKIPVFANTTSLEATLKQAPYRWSQTDVNAGAMNAAEFMGKQLAGKKGQYAGDEAMHNQTRKFGVVYADPVTDAALFNKTAAKYGVKFAPGAVISYPAIDDPFGDPTVAQEQAPVDIAKLKSAGVTTILLLTDSSMTKALLNQATANDYHPEWIIGAFNYNDLGFFARQYDQNQWAHAFGISNLPPGVREDVAPTTNPALDAVQWYWGKGKGTSSVLHGNLIDKFMRGVAYAGPKLTPRTLEQGLFSAPAYGGSASDDTYTIRQGFGRTDGLPYDEYLPGNKDFTAAWWDPDTVGPPLTNLGLPGGQGTLWYLNGAQRYYAGHWPTKPLKFFDKSKAIYQFDTQATPPVPVPCEGCPSETGQGEPAASS